MTGNIWMCSHLLDTEDLEFGMHEFITYKMGQKYYGIGIWKDQYEKEGFNPITQEAEKAIVPLLSGLF